MITQSLGARKGSGGWSVAAAAHGGGGARRRRRFASGVCVGESAQTPRVRPGRLKLAVMWNLLTQLSELVGSYLGAQLI